MTWSAALGDQMNYKVKDFPRTLKGYQQFTYTTSHTQKNDYVCVMD